MPLLPNIASEYVQKGWWRNLTAPAYRQHLWTATNVEALMFLGLIGIIGTIAGNALWSISRHFLQPAVQLADPGDKKLKLSRNAAITALWAEIKDVNEDFKLIWNKEHSIKQRVGMSLGRMRGKHRQALRPSATAIELRYGVFAILNIFSFAVLGIYAPFFLAEGLQGETIVQAKEDFRYSFEWNRRGALYNEGVRQRVFWDFERCVTNDGVWSQTDYCVDLRNTLPRYNAEDVNLTDPIFADSPYLFLIEKGDPNFTPFRLSRNTSLQDVTLNAKPGGKNILHELTCVPISLSQFITQVNGSFQLRIKDLVPSLSRDTTSFVFDSMLLKTSNAVGSGYEIYGSKFSEGGLPDHTKPVTNDGDQGATWYQTDIDATLPWVQYGPDSTLEELMRRGETAGAILQGRLGPRLTNFVITFKPGEMSWLAENPSDDPIFGAHRPWRTGRYTADHEVSALGCAEVFKVCSTGRCTEVRELDGWLEVCYPKIMSVWVSTLIDPTYGRDIRHFFGRRWQDDVAARFILSMLRVRHASTYAAEQDFTNQDPNSRNDYNFWISDPLLYRNSDYTNINVWGLVATAGGYLYIIAASYWLVLLSPLVLPLKFLARAARRDLENVKALMTFGRIWVHAASSATTNFVRTGHPLRRHRPMRSDTLPMDTWNVLSENDEPDNTLRLASNEGVEATS